MAEPTIQLGGGNWAGKSGNLLGYYEQNKKFYAEDFTFSRSTTGTYTDSDGYIQEMPYNLVQQSNDFDTTWIIGASALDLTSGQSGYDGSNDAWLLKKNTSGSRYIQQSITRPSGQYSFSVYLKAESTDWVYIWAYDGSTTVNAYFDLNNGIVGNTSGLDSTNVVSVGNGWYRCTITFTQAITSVRIYPAYANGSISTGTDNGIYIQNAQVNKGSSAKTYFPTTTRLNMPRVDYLNNSNGSLILEPQRTNLLTQSESFESYWIKTNITASDNEIISPDGTQNACLITDNSTDGYHNINRIDITPTDSNNYTRSFYVKKGTARYVVISARQISSSSSTSWIYDFDDNDWSVIAASGEGQKIEVLSNGWIRLSVTIISSSNFNNDVSIGISSGSTMADTSYIGSGDTLYVWGGQIEQGSYATTLINTSGSSVTRNADACSITNVADRIGQTEGTIYVDINAMQELDFPEITIDNNNNTDRIVLTRNTSGKWGIFAASSIAGSAFSAAYSTVIGNDGKFAIAYSSSNYALWRNGVEIATLTYDLPSALSTLRLNGRSTNDFYSIKKVQNIKLYNTRLTDSELATLTTL